MKIWFIALVLMLFVQTASAQQINRVNVNIGDEGRCSVLLLERMDMSMTVIAEQLLLDKKVAEVVVDKAEYVRLLTEIGERVMTGYRITSLNVMPDETARIDIRVAPWSDRITDVVVDLQFSGVDASTIRFLKAKLPNLEQRIKNVLRGSSIDAADWAGGIVRKMVRDEANAKLPEFKAAVDIVRKKDGAVVQVVIYPVGRIVQDVNYSMTSESIPNLLLMRLKKTYAERVNAFRGLPVDYVKRNISLLTEMLLNELEAEDVIKKYNLKPQVILLPSDKLGVNINLEAEEYKIWFEGYGDIGRDEENLSGRAHFGKYFSENDEFFSEVSVTLDDVEWNLATGYAWNKGKTSLGYRYIWQDSENVYLAEYDIDDKWRLRAEYFSGDNVTEFGVRYRIHEFLSAEYVYSSDKPYFRLIGNL